MCWFARIVHRGKMCRSVPARRQAAAGKERERSAVALPPSPRHKNATTTIMIIIIIIIEIMIYQDMYVMILGIPVPMS